MGGPPIPFRAGRRDGAERDAVAHGRLPDGTKAASQAVARLRADGKPVTLTLAGDGEETEALSFVLNYIKEKNL